MYERNKKDGENSFNGDYFWPAGDDAFFEHGKSISRSDNSLPSPSPVYKDSVKTRKMYRNLYIEQTHTEE